MTRRIGRPTPVTRRSVLKGMAAASAAAAGPWVVSSNVLAAAGEVNVLMWSDYLPPGFLKSFEEKTGIKVNYTGIGSNEEIITKMKATKGRGVDLCSPTNMRSPQWVDLDLLQPFDYGRINNLGNVNPAMLRVGDNEWNFQGRARTGCLTSGAPRESPGAPTCGRRRARERFRATGTSGRRT